MSELNLDSDSEAESSRAKLWGRVTSADEGIVKKRKQIISRIGEKVRMYLGPQYGIVVVHVLFTVDGSGYLGLCITISHRS